MFMSRPQSLRNVFDVFHLLLLLSTRPLAVFFPTYYSIPYVSNMHLMALHSTT